MGQLDPYFNISACVYTGTRVGAHVVALPPLRRPLLLPVGYDAGGSMGAAVAIEAGGEIYV